MESQTGISLMSLFEGLGYCLVVFFIGIHFYKRYVLKQSGPVKRHMQLVERLQISSKSSLLLVDVDGRRVLLTVGPDRTSFMSESIIEGDALSPNVERDDQPKSSYSSFEEIKEVELCQAAN